MDQRTALIVFAKVPVPGQVKTRLTNRLTPEEAAALYAAFLGDAFDQYRSLEAALRLYLAPHAGALPAGLVPPHVEVRLQKGEGLGERMLHAFLETFAAGYEQIVIIGTDHPTLPTAFIEAAFDALAGPPAICIGPSDDGGYYLLGMNECYPELFVGMSYSHSAVFEQTMARAAGTPASLTVLPLWYDVDTPASLQRLNEDLRSEPAEASRTRAVMAALQAAHPWLREEGGAE
jgi:rSAM/selenodomain-associated transferase 1